MARLIFCVTANGNKLLVLLLLMVSFCSLGSAPIESVLLDDKLAKDLGFSISIENDKVATMLDLSGPQEINGCPAYRVGHFIMESGQDISGYVANVSKGISPISMGYIRHGKGFKMLVFIDYICPNGRATESRRYEFWSEKD